VQAKLPGAPLIGLPIRFDLAQDGFGCFHLRLSHLESGTIQALQYKRFAVLTIERSQPLGPISHNVA
jgi:hypothetical protein